MLKTSVEYGAWLKCFKNNKKDAMRKHLTSFQSPKGFSIVVFITASP